MMFRIATWAAVGLGFLAASPGAAFGIAGKDKVATPGRPVQAEAGWPEGVLNVVNDATRTAGWRPWFSECPNDATYYAMRVGGIDDLNRLTNLMAAVQAKGVRVRLDPARTASHGDLAAAVFSLGNQTLLDAWFAQLREVEPGVRGFGVHRYRRPPAALPPTLTFYAGHPAVDLTRLDVPAGVEVCAAVPEAYRAEHPGDPVVKAIDAFVIRHRAKRKAADLHDAPTR